VTVPVRSGRNRSYQHDAIGRVSEVAGPFGFIRPFDPNNAPTMPSGSETVLRTTETRAGIFSYYYDSQNRRTRKEYPTGDMDEFVWGPGRELLMETAPFKLGIGPDGAHSVDEYVHLGGRPVLTLRRLYNAKDGRTRWRPEFRDFDGASQCARHDEPGRCEPHAIITDVIGKPVLTLDTVGRISGVMEYDPGGLVNRATYWDDMSNTPHEWCWWVGYGMKVATGGLAPLQSQLRTRMPRVAQSTNSCVGQFKLSAAGVWSQEPNNHWECGPKSHTVMPWVSMADNDLVALKYCSWDGAPVNPQPLGISVEGFEYRKFEAGATPYLVPLRYPGQYFDEETEFHENWNRYYDPSTGRYLSPEPLLQSPNWVTSELSQGHQVPAYAYARNNPMMNVDPTGLFVDWDVRDGDVAVALLDIGMDPVLGPMMRRLWADTRNGVNLRRAQPLSLKERGGGFTSYPRKNFRGGDTCDSNFDPEGHHEFVKGLGPLALSEDEVRALIAHELGHAYYSLYGGDADRGSIDWENRMRLGPQRSYWRNSTDRTGFHGWPR
jgi:RHS repeat-associated protein